MFFNEFNDKLLKLGREQADRALQANAVAARSAFSIAGLQLAAAEERFKAASGLAQQALALGDRESVRAFWPRTWDFTRESFEKLTDANKEVFDVLVRTGEELAELTPVNRETVKKAARTAKTA